MASPHVAGAAAVLLQANPNLTYDQVRSAMQATATPGDGLPFWQIGYGHVDLAAAVKLVQSKNWSRDLINAQAQADRRVLNEDGFRVRRSDFWTYDAPRVSIAGLTDSRTFTTDVLLGTTHLKVTLSHPSLAVVDLNEMNYTVTVLDAAGRTIGTTTEAASGAGTASVLIDFSKLSMPVTYGAFQFRVTGDLAVSDPDTLDSESLLGRMVTLQVAQLDQK